MRSSHSVYHSIWQCLMLNCINFDWCFLLFGIIVHSLSRLSVLRTASMLLCHTPLRSAKTLPGTRVLVPGTVLAPSHSFIWCESINPQNIRTSVGVYEMYKVRWSQQNFIFLCRINRVPVRYFVYSCTSCTTVLLILQKQWYNHSSESSFGVLKKILAEMKECNQIPGCVIIADSAIQSSTVARKRLTALRHVGRRTTPQAESSWQLFRRQGQVWLLRSLHAQPSLLPEAKAAD